MGRAVCNAKMSVGMRFALKETIFFLGSGSPRRFFVSCESGLSGRSGRSCLRREYGGFCQGGERGGGCWHDGCGGEDIMHGHRFRTSRTDGGISSGMDLRVWLLFFLGMW